MACRNPQCAGKNPIKSGWCTASACKKMRTAVMAAKKAALEQTAAAVAGVQAVAPAQYCDGLECWQVHSVHGMMECGLACLGGTQAPPADDQQIHFTVFGSFAATEDDHEADRGKTQLRLVTFKEILKTCSEKDVKKLSAYEKNRIERHRAARKRLYEVLEAEEEVPEELD